MRTIAYSILLAGPPFALLCVGIWSVGTGGPAMHHPQPKVRKKVNTVSLCSFALKNIQEELARAFAH